MHRRKSFDDVTKLVAASNHARVRHSMTGKNHEAAQAFADAFDPPLNVVRTERINGQLAKDAYCVSGMLCDEEIGISAFVFGNGHLKAYVEFVGGRDMSYEIGRKFAKLTEVWNAE